MSSAYEHGTFSSDALVDLLTAELDGARREAELLRSTAANKEKEFRVALKALVDEQKTRDAANEARVAESEKSLRDLKSRVASGEYGGVAARRVRELEEQCAEGERAMEAMHDALQKLLAAQKEGTRSSPLESEKRAHRSDLLDLAIERSAHADAIASLEDQLRAQRRAYVEDITQMARFVPDVKSLPFRVRTTLGMEWPMKADAEARTGHDAGSSDDDDDDDVQTLHSEDSRYSLASGGSNDVLWPVSTAASVGFDYDIDNCTITSDERYSLESDLDEYRYDFVLPMRRGSRTETKRKENGATQTFTTEVALPSALTRTADSVPTSTPEEVGDDDKDFIQSMLKSAIDKYYAKKTRKNAGDGLSPALPPLHDVVSPLISTLLSVVDGDERRPASRFDARMSPGFIAAVDYQGGGAPSTVPPAMVPGTHTPTLDEIVTSVIETILKDDTTSRRFRERLRASSMTAHRNEDRGADITSTPPSATANIDAVVASVVQRLSIASGAPPAPTLATAPPPFSYHHPMSRADDHRKDDDELVGEELPPPLPRPSVADLVEKALDFETDYVNGDGNFNFDASSDNSDTDVDEISQPVAPAVVPHDEPPPLPPSPSQQPMPTVAAHDDHGSEGDTQERKPPPPIPEVLKERLRMSSLALQRADSINIDVDDIDSSDSEDDGSEIGITQSIGEQKDDAYTAKSSDVASPSANAVEETVKSPAPQTTTEPERARASSQAPLQEQRTSIAATEASEIAPPMTRARKSTLRLGTALPGMAIAVMESSALREGEVDDTVRASSPEASNGGDSPSSSAIQPLAEQLAAGRNRMASRAKSVISPTSSLRDDEHVLTSDTSDKKKKVDDSIDTKTSGVATSVPTTASVPVTTSAPVDQRSEQKQKQDEQQQQGTVGGEARGRSGSRLAIATPPRRALGAASKELMRKLNK